MKTKIIRLYKENRSIVWFMLKLTSAWLFWKLFIWFAGEERIPVSSRKWPWFSAQWETFNDWIRMFLLKATDLTLQLFGYSTQLDYQKHVVKIDGTCGVGVGNYCIGLQLWFIMAILVLFYPNARWRVRIMFAALGIAVINILNVIRLATIAICTKYMSAERLQFNHDFIFNVVVYIFIFLLYLWFVRRFGNYSKESGNYHTKSDESVN